MEKKKSSAAPEDPVIQTRQFLIQKAASLSLDELMTLALDTIEPLTQSVISFFHFVSPDEQSLTLQQWSTRTLEQFCKAEGKGIHYDLDQAGVWADSVRKKKPVIHNDYSAVVNKRGLPDGHAPVIRELVVPVMRDNRVVAVLGVGNKPVPYTQADADNLSYHADVVWEIIEKKRVEQDIVFQKDIETALSRLASLLLTTTSLERISNRVLKVAKELTKSEYGFVGTFDDSQELFTSHTMTKDIWEECRIPDKTIVFEKCEGLWGWVLENRQPVMVNDLENDPRSTGTPPGHIKITAFLGVPAMIGDQVAGQIALANPATRYMDIDLTIVKRLATLFAMAIQRHRYEESLLSFQTQKAEAFEKLVRKRTAELHQSRTMLENVFNSQQDAIFILDSSPDRPRIIDCNRSATTLFDHDKNTLITLPVDELFAPAEKNRLPLFLSPRQLSHTKKQVHEFEMLNKNGRVFFAAVTISPLQHQKKEYLGTVLVIRDITAWKEATKAVERNESRFRELFANVALGIAIYESPDNGKQFILKDINKAGEAIADRDKNELIGRDVKDLFPGIKEMGLLDIFRRVFEARVPEHLLSAPYRDNHLDATFDSYVFTLPSGELVNIFEDVTQKKEDEKRLKTSEERLKLTLDSVSDAVWDWTIDTNEIYFSPRYYTMLGYNPDELPMRFETWETLLHPDDLPQALKTIEHHLVSSRPFEMEFRMKTKAGDYRWILGRGKTVAKDDAGKAQRMVGTHMDITERKNMELRLRHSQKMEAMGVLAGGIAHDFNNILAAIVGYAELVMEEFPEKTKAFERVSGILSASERARTLISQILTFSRKKESVLNTIDIRVVVKEAVNFMRASLPSTLLITHDIPEDLPPIQGDPTQVHQMVTNLATNAAQAMNQAGTLAISLAAVELGPDFSKTSPDIFPGTFIKLSVSDNGCGIPEDILPRIFDPFFTTKEKSHGTGLGLATVHGIVKEHGGDIIVDSTPGKGSRFDVYLPAVTREIDEEPPEDTVAEKGTEHLLVVDDEQVLPYIVQDMLEEMGYKVTTMTDSQEALSLFEKHPDRFDMLISDITMPRLTGVELGIAFRNIRPGIPVILWSGNSTLLSKKKTEEIGGAGLLRKPFKKKELSLAIRSVLDGKTRE